jgi:hypothetical protein
MTKYWAPCNEFVCKKYIINIFQSARWGVIFVMKTTKLREFMQTKNKMFYFCLCILSYIQNIMHYCKQFEIIKKLRTDCNFPVGELQLTTYMEQSCENSSVKFQLKNSRNLSVPLMDCIGIRLVLPLIAFNRRSHRPTYVYATSAWTKSNRRECQVSCINMIFNSVGWNKPSVPTKKLFFSVGNLQALRSNSALLGRVKFF